MTCQDEHKSAVGEGESARQRRQGDGEAVDERYRQEK